MTDNNEILEKLILAGAVEVAGLDPSGEFLYSFTPQMPELFPEFYEHVSYHYSAAITDLWTNGYLEITLDENGDEVLDGEKYNELYTLSSMFNIYQFEAHINENYDERDFKFKLDNVAKVYDFLLPDKIKKEMDLKGSV